MLIISKSNYNNVSIIISIEFFCEIIWPDSQIINIYTFNTKSVSHIFANLSNWSKNMSKKLKYSKLYLYTVVAIIVIKAVNV